MITTRSAKRWALMPTLHASVERLARFTFALALMTALFFAVPILQPGMCAQAEAASTPVATPLLRPVTMDEVNAIAYRLYCPVCPNERLDSCQTVACAEWRATIAQQLTEGRTEPEIRAYFVERYGERVLGTPESPTLYGLSVYVPVALAALLLAGGVFTFARWRRGKRAFPHPNPPPAGERANHSEGTDDPYRAMLERDLRG